MRHMCVPGRYTGHTSLMYNGHAHNSRRDMDVLAGCEELLWKLMNHNYHRNMEDEGLALGLGVMLTFGQHDRCTPLTLKPAPHHPCSYDSCDSSISIATPHQPKNPYVVSRIVRQGPAICPALFNTLPVTNGYISR